jgi:pseudaminic acid biosynthesis-associated methylase
MKFRTEQEEFWAGNFGEEYTDRNRGQHRVVSNTAFFAKILRRTCGVDSILEFGANIGLNLIAIRKLLPQVELSALEINPKAVGELRTIERVKVYHQSIFDFIPERTWNLVFTKGFLIHISPEKLGHVYNLLHCSSSRYILLCEYYNPTAMEVIYRGHSNKLFKRDFAGELMDTFGDLDLVDYGFVYHRDNNFRQDDITWFLVQKR